MLYGNVFISHGLRFVFCIDQDFVQVIADIQLSSSAYLGQFFYGLLCFVFKHIALDAHFCDQFHDQAVFQSQQAVQQMRLVNLLVSIFICQLFAVLNCFH